MNGEAQTGQAVRLLSCNLFNHPHDCKDPPPWSLSATHTGSAVQKVGTEEALMEDENCVFVAIHTAKPNDTDFRSASLIKCSYVIAHAGCSSTSANDAFAMFDALAMPHSGVGVLPGSIQTEY